jgi:hypothetical protein
MLAVRRSTAKLTTLRKQVRLVWIYCSMDVHGVPNFSFPKGHCCSIATIKLQWL